MTLVLAKPKQYFDNEKICYQQIYKSYWYAKYGELTIVIHKDVGYVNASLLCKTYKKRFSHWSANKNIKSTITDLAKDMSTNGFPIKPEQMLITVEGGSGKFRKHVCGTYVHPILFPHVVSWLDSTFMGIVGIMANNFFGLQSNITSAGLALILQDMKAPKVVQEEKEGDDSSEDEDVVPDKLKKSFKIYARNDPKFPYQAFESDEKKMTAAIKRFQKSPSGTQQVLLEIDDIPDVVSLYSMIKSSGLIQSNKNTFKSKFPTDVLIQKIKELSWSNVTKQVWQDTIIKSDLCMSDDEQ